MVFRRLVCCSWHRWVSEGEEAGGLVRVELLAVMLCGYPSSSWLFFLGWILEGVSDQIDQRIVDRS